MGNWREHQEQDGTGQQQNYSEALITSGIGSGMNQYPKWKGSGSPPTGGTPVEYDFLGNVTRATLKVGGVPKDRRYYYDFASRLTQVEDCNDSACSSTTWAVTYSYDGMNRRTIRRVAHGTVSPLYFFYDGPRVVEEYQSGAAIPDTRYVWGNGIDELLVMERPTISGPDGRYYFSADYLGSIIGIRKNDGTLAATFRYGPYGELLSSTSGTGEDLSLFTYRYTGQRLDSETGLYYYKNRYYSSEMGRFMHRDPLGPVEGSNLYQYTSSTPPNRTDAFGLCSGTVCDQKAQALANDRAFDLQMQGFSGRAFDHQNWSRTADTAYRYRAQTFATREEAEEAKASYDEAMRNGALQGPVNPTPAVATGNVTITYADRSTRDVAKTYTEYCACSSDSAGLISTMKSDFSFFADYSGDFYGGLGSAEVSFEDTPIKEGVVIEIESTISEFGISYDINTSVTVEHTDENSFTFTTDEGHLLHPAWIQFASEDVGKGENKLTVTVNGDFANPVSRFTYDVFGGWSLENNIWTSFLNNVCAQCGE